VERCHHGKARDAALGRFALQDNGDTAGENITGQEDSWRGFSFIKVNECVCLVAMWSLQS